MPENGGAALTLLVPGDLNLRTGGYGYDREIVAGLRARGWAVDIAGLDGSFPHPTPEARAHAVRALAALPDGALVLADGLAFGAMADEAEREAQRLRFVGLVHHPLADETGVTAEHAAAFLASEQRALACTRGVVVTSANTARRLADFAVPAGRVAVVEPGTAAKPLGGGTASRGLEVVQLLTVATLSTRKGYDVLLDALAQVRDLPWHLTCAGSHTLQPQTAAAIVQQVRALDLDDRVAFVGEVEGAALDALYDEADLFVLPTRHEGYGMAVAEALAWGVPVLSTRTGAIPSLVGDRAGMIVRTDVTSGHLALALRLMLAPLGLARYRAGAALRRADLPTWDTAVTLMADALIRFGAHGIVQR